MSHQQTPLATQHSSDFYQSEADADPQPPYDDGQGNRALQTAAESGHCQSPAACRNQPAVLQEDPDFQWSGSSDPITSSLSEFTARALAQFSTDAAANVDRFKAHLPPVTAAEMVENAFQIVSAAERAAASDRNIRVREAEITFGMVRRALAMPSTFSIEPVPPPGAHPAWKTSEHENDSVTAETSSETSSTSETSTQTQSHNEPEAMHGVVASDGQTDHHVSMQVLIITL